MNGEDAMIIGGVVLMAFGHWILGGVLAGLGTFAAIAKAMES